VYILIKMCMYILLCFVGMVVSMVVTRMLNMVVDVQRLILKDYHLRIMRLIWTVKKCWIRKNELVKCLYKVVPHPQGKSAYVCYALLRGT